MMVEVGEQGLEVAGAQGRRGRIETPGGCSSQAGHRSSGSGWGLAMAGSFAC
jgi:hypothetical protein